MNPNVIRCVCFFLIGLALLPVSVQAQETMVGRVWKSIDNDDTNATIIELGELEVHDVIEVTVIRLTGDLIPYVGLRNTTFVTESGITTQRYAIRFNATDASRVFRPEPYEIEDDAQSGDYELIIAHEQESGFPTYGDFMVNFKVTRPDGTVVNLPESIRASNPIQLAAQFSDSPILIEAGEDRTYTGHINNEVFAVYYLAQLPTGQPVRIEMTPTDGDLIPYLIISPADQQAFDRNNRPQQDGDSVFLLYESGALPESLEGYYIIAATREDFDQGNTSGDFQFRVIPVDEAQG